METTSIRFQVFTALCMADMEFANPGEFMELFKQATDYITEELKAEETPATMFDFVIN